MANRIAMTLLAPYLENPIALYLEYLDSNGQPWCFVQNAEGIWQPSVQNRLPPGGMLQGLQAAGPSSGPYFFGINNNGLLLYAPAELGSFFETVALNYSDNANYSVRDFAVDYPQPSGPMLGAFINPYGDLWALPLGQMPNAVTPVLLGTAFGGQYLGSPGTNYVAVGHVALGDTANMEGKSIGVIFAINDGSFGTAKVQGWTTTDQGMTFTPVNLGPVPANTYFCSVRLVNGNPDGTLQAILLTAPTPETEPEAGLLPYRVTLFWDSSGTASSWTFDAPAAFYDNPTVAMTAAAKGNVGNLQVIGIGPSGVPIPVPLPPNVAYPYWAYIAPVVESYPNLFWQDTGGNWNSYNNPDSYGPGYGPPWSTSLPTTQKRVCDVAISMGPQNYLQVGYIGFDGNVYINWQDNGGTWHWYPGLNGTGLP
jgi:hypothetical protein